MAPTTFVGQLFFLAAILSHCPLLHSSDVVPVAEVSVLLRQEANAAMGLNGQMLGDRALKVENAKSARETTPQGATNPYTAIQLQQMQQLQLAQMQSSTLAAQVCMHVFVLIFAMQCLLSKRLLSMYIEWENGPYHLFSPVITHVTHLQCFSFCHSPRCIVTGGSTACTGEDQPQCPHSSHVYQLSITEGSCSCSCGAAAEEAWANVRARQC